MSNTRKIHLINNVNKLNPEDVDALQKLDITKKFVQHVSNIDKYKKDQIISDVNAAEKEIISTINNRNEKKPEKSKDKFDIQLQDTSSEKISKLVNNVTAELSKALTKEEVVVVPAVEEIVEQVTDTTQLNELRRQNGVLRAQLLIQTNAVANLEQRLLIANRNYAALQTRYNALDAERKTLIGELDNICINLGIRKQDHRQIIPTIEALKRRTMQLEARIGQLTTDLTNAERNIVLLQQQITAQQTTIQQLTNEIAIKNNEIQQLKIDLLGEQKNHAQELADMETEYNAELARRIKEIEQKFNRDQTLLQQRFETIINRLQEEIERLKSGGGDEKKRYEEEKRRYEEELERQKEEYTRMRNLILSQEQKIQGYEQSLLAAAERNRKSIEEIEGKHNVEIQRLSGEIDKRKTKITELENRLRNIISEKDEQLQLMIELSEEEKKRYQLDEEKRFAERTKEMRDNYEDNKKLLLAEIRDRDQKIAEFKTDIDLAEKQKQQLTGQLGNYVRENQQLKTELERLKKELEEERIKLRNTNVNNDEVKKYLEDINEKTNEIVRINAELDLKKNDVMRLTEQLAKVQEELDKQKQENMNLRDTIRGLEAQIGLLENNNKDLLHQLKDLTQRYDDQIVKFSIELQTERKEIELLRKKIDEIEKDSAKKDEVIKQQSDEYNKIMAEIKQKQEEFDKMQKEIKNKYVEKQEYDTLDRAYKQLEKNYNHDYETIKTQLKQIENLKLQIKQLEEKPQFFTQELHNELVSQIDTLKVNLQKEQEKNKKLEAEKKDMDEKYTELENSALAINQKYNHAKARKKAIEERDVEIKRLEERLRELEAKKDKYEDIARDMRHLDMDNASKRQVYAVKDDLAQARVREAELETKIKELESNKETLESDYKSLKSQMASLTTTLNDVFEMNVSINEFPDFMKQLKDGVISLQNNLTNIRERIKNQLDILDEELKSVDKDDLNATIEKYQGTLITIKAIIDNGGNLDDDDNKVEEVTGGTEITGGSDFLDSSIFGSLLMFSFGSIIICLLVLFIFYIGHQIYKNQIRSKVEIYY